jgi:Ni,Fe-hydrogenase III large subunit
MAKHVSRAEQLCGLGSEKVVLTYNVLEDVLGIQLPKTAANRRAFWQNINNQRRVKNLLGLSCNYYCKVKHAHGMVIFTKKRK